MGSLLLFPPLGIPLLWMTPWSRAGKISGSIFSGILLLAVLTGEASEPTAASVESPVLAPAATPANVAPITTPAYDEAVAEAAAATEKTVIADSSADWARIALKWQQALSSLGDIPLNSDDYDQAQIKIAEYERNYEDAIAQQAAAELVEAEAIAQQGRRRGNPAAAGTAASSIGH